MGLIQRVKKRVLRVEAHWLFGKGILPGVVINKGDADSVLGHERAHHYWYPWVKCNCKQCFLLSTSKSKFTLFIKWQSYIIRCNALLCLRFEFRILWEINKFCWRNSNGKSCQCDSICNLFFFFFLCMRLGKEGRLETLKGIRDRKTDEDRDGLAKYHWYQIADIWPRRTGKHRLTFLGSSQIFSPALFLSVKTGSGGVDISFGLGDRCFDLVWDGMRNVDFNLWVGIRLIFYGIVIFSNRSSPLQWVIYWGFCRQPWKNCILSKNINLLPTGVYVYIYIYIYIYIVRVCVCACACDAQTGKERCER